MEKNRQRIATEQKLSQRLTQQQLRLVRMLDMSAPELDDEVEREMEVLTEFTAQNGGKLWHYVLIPHTLVNRSYSFNYILSQTKLK